MHDVLTIEKAAYEQFLKAFKEGQFKGQRLGQAFHHHFRLEKLTSRELADQIWNKDGDEAVAFIKTNIILT